MREIAHAEDMKKFNAAVDNIKQLPVWNESKPRRLASHVDILRGSSRNHSSITGAEDISMNDVKMISKGKFEITTPRDKRTSYELTFG